ncbi:DNA-3-methyladenine glycosylase I [Mycetocola manganoxydans]|uniref:DNA-3-methyladenine glycosylase I n=1 Tax=Mycetocola manganoxydans TaxID=699879 RepID=A0A3L7A0L9_9MICO|nr:DNA-3-methyladenine glycosylase I [Mycetocola manganoxydans]RLP73759.1 DNA-3-methyladenine glycosylase I [Mycetocola manganoxydans]GHD43216.1 DNA-3-methyladenine glycosylase I [Mycetocola manganoxydans]
MAVLPSIVEGADATPRCGWVGADPEYQRYHDEEWGTPLLGDRAVFEKISLEGFQAGLSWITILKRRPAFRRAFANFDIDTVAAMTEDDVERLATDASIIRHRGKIRAVISNARVTRDLDESLSDLVWRFAPTAERPRPTRLDVIPAITTESTALSIELRRRGYRFVGPTTMYALMQSAGLVDDHVVGCWRAPD